MMAKVWFTVAAQALIVGALLFGAAGTFKWPAGWAFMVLLFALTVGITLMLARHDPALLEERMRPFVQKAQPVWDRILVPLMLLLFLGWFALMGVDAVRIRASRVPLWLQGVGAVGVALGMWICARAFRANTFLAPVVKIQKERGHKVIATGPYAVVRHPLYAGALVFMPSAALMLGSWWGLAATLVLAGVLMVRTVLEERELRAGLDGYANYTQRVRYRLVPGIW